MAEEGPDQSGPPRSEQWLPVQLRSGPEKGEKRPNALGSGALHFIRTRSSIRRELKRHSNQSKAAENLIVSNENCGSGGGGLGKWLREHLGGSRGSHEVNSTSVKRSLSRNGDVVGEKSVPRLTYASQNLYCSLPREHGRPFSNGTGHKVIPIEIQGPNRPRSNSANFCGKNTPLTPVPPVLRRGGPVYSSDGKSMRRRNRDRRRHSLNVSQEAQEKRLVDHRVDGPPEISMDGTVPLRNVDSQSDGLNPGAESRESKTHLMKMLTFAPDVAASASSQIRFSVTVDSSNNDTNDDWVEAGEDDQHPVQYQEQHEADEQEEDGEEEDEEGEGEEDEEPEEEDLEIEEKLKGEETQEDDKKQQEEEDYNEEGEEDEEEEEGEEEPNLEEEKILIDYSFSIPKEIKIRSENDLSKIPSEVYGDRDAMLQMVKELVIERPNLTLRNRYLEYKCFKYLQTIQVTGSPPIDDGSNLEDEVERDRYMNFLGNYKKESGVFRGRENQIKLSLDNLREKLKERSSKDGASFGELTSRETAVAVDLVFATTGRKLTNKRVEEMIRRQTSRRKKVAHERYTFIREWYLFEETDARIRRLETLGPGMKISQYEADFSANLTAKTKIDEKNKELQKARVRVCGMMAAITHGKVKLAFLNDEIECKKSCYSHIVKSVHKRREELSTMRSRLSITRNRYLKKRETAGLMLALPTLREMERVEELRDFWKHEVDCLRSSIRKPRGTRKPKSQLEKKPPITKKGETPVPTY